MQIAIAVQMADDLDCGGVRTINDQILADTMGATGYRQCLYLGVAMDCVGKMQV